MYLSYSSPPFNRRVSYQYCKDEDRWLMFLIYVDFLCVRFNFSWFLMVTLVSLCNSFFYFYFILFSSCLCYVYVCMSVYLLSLLPKWRIKRYIYIFQLKWNRAHSFTVLGMGSTDNNSGHVQKADSHSMLEISGWSLIMTKHTWINQSINQSINQLMMPVSCSSQLAASGSGRLVLAWAQTWHSVPGLLHHLLDDAALSQSRNHRHSDSYNATDLAPRLGGNNYNKTIDVLFHHLLRSPIPHHSVCSVITTLSVGLHYFD